MNKQEYDILRTLIESPIVNQRQLARISGLSLGAVNKVLHNLVSAGYLDDDFRPTQASLEEYRADVPKNAIILAAGFGTRMVPINLTPKALLEVKGEPLIERTIKQLHETGITDITIVVGFMKEAFDYLIDEYGVRLVVNPEYSSKNNLYSLSLVADRISDTYVIPSDIWSRQNPFSRHEMYSWYMVSDVMSCESDVRVNRKMELVKVGENAWGNSMIGISYLAGKDSGMIRKRIMDACGGGKHDGDFWEAVLYEGDRMLVHPKVVSGPDEIEINTYEQLRELDGESNHLKSDALEVICRVFDVGTKDIEDISVLKKGMTNRSFLFSVRKEKYIMRIPGAGTDMLVNRRQEADVFREISGRGICDDPIYINPETGYKITKYLEGARTCNPESIEDLKKCIRKLRDFHSMKLSVPHTFDIFGQIDFYESLRMGRPSVYRDYEQTKANVMKLKPYIDAQEKDWCLTHIDAVPDNFLFYRSGKDDEELLQLTDWEYSGMQDPHVDIAMFCIYSLYDKKHIDWMIDEYFDSECSSSTRAKIYCYISACGLLWSNWCEYKRMLGIEFGEYSLMQYRFAKDYYRHAAEAIGASGKTTDIGIKQDE